MENYTWRVIYYLNKINLYCIENHKSIFVASIFWEYESKIEDDIYFRFINGYIDINIPFNTGFINQYKNLYKEIINKKEIIVYPYVLDRVNNKFSNTAKLKIKPVKSLNILNVKLDNLHFNNIKTKSIKNKSNKSNKSNTIFDLWKPEGTPEEDTKIPLEILFPWKISINIENISSQCPFKEIIKEYTRCHAPTGLIDFSKNEVPLGQYPPCNRNICPFIVEEIEEESPIEKKKLKRFIEFKKKD